jgi:hypothetical protein
MKAKTPVRWISNSREGSSENWFIELFITSKLDSITAAKNARIVVLGKTLWKIPLRRAILSAVPQTRSGNFAVL